MGIKLFRRQDQSPPGAAAGAGWKERVKGVVQGTAFRFEPPVPALDRLDRPVVLEALPAAPFPEQTLQSRMRRLFAGKRAERHSHQQRLHWRFYDTVDAVLSLVSPEPYQPAEGLGLGWSRGTPPRPSPGITHPYQLKSAFELLAELPESFAAERAYLDDLLSSVLIAYKKEVSRRTVGSLTFFREAQEYFFSGYRIEKSILKTMDLDAKVAACQQVYDSYHHGINYYIYALLSREPFDSQNNIFMFFCNALYFRARIEWNGQLLDRAATKKLPNRTWVLFFALRDRTVPKQFQADDDYARQFRTLLRAFPETTPSKPAPHHKPVARTGKHDRVHSSGHIGLRKAPPEAADQA
ncbi:MAG: hypothetical protein WCO00_02385 [Rhodospirillaceae bacterium]